MPIPAPTLIDPCACPLCGKPNQCAMAMPPTNGQPVANCWCVKVSFTPELLAQVPEAAKHKACICQTCATQQGSPHA